VNVAEDRFSQLTSVTRSVEAAGFALLFLMLFVPGAGHLLKVCLLLLLLVVLLFRILIERSIALHPEVVCGCLLFSAIGIAYVLRGYLNGAPGALRVSTVYVIWPLTNAVLITGLARVARLWGVARLLIWTTNAICLYCGTYILWSAGWWPDALYFPVGAKQTISFHQGTMEFSVASMSSLLFLVPFVAAALLAWPRGIPVARIWLWLGLALGIVMGLLSGRRAFQLVLGLAPILALAFRRLLPKDRTAERSSNLRRSLIGATVVVVVTVVLLQRTLGLNLAVVWATFTTGFQFAVDPVAHSRATQFDALMDGWLGAPFFGSGHGAPASVIRAADMPWAYELAYLGLLYHTGLVGLVLYAVGVSWIYVEGIRVIRKGSLLSPLMVSILTGTSTFLIANATNPYLEKFDYVWTIFLPLAVVNASLLNRGQPNGPGRLAGHSRGDDE